MHSSADRFWNAVERWCSSKPKPTIAVECSTSGSQPFLNFRAVVDEFSREESITFRLEEGTSRIIELKGCEARFAFAPLDLAEMDAVVVFRVACDVEDDSVIFTFTELRDFGKLV